MDKISPGLLAYYCRLTPEIQTCLVTLSACQKTIELLRPEPTRERLLRHESLLQSSLYSARIEGNPLKRSDLGLSHSNTTQHKLEINNLDKAYAWVAELLNPTPVDLQFFKLLHSKTMIHLTPDAGTFRNEESAICNQAGIAVYLPPSPQLIKPQLSYLCQWIQAMKYPPAITAVMAHYIFEKIHPFLDGNGRVGRLLLFHLLHQAELSMRGLLVVEKILATQRANYYDHLAPNTTDRTQYVLFMLSCLAEASELALEKLRLPSTTASDDLLPRRRELLNIIRDHELVSFNFLSRRFPSIKKSTLHNDIHHLLRAELIHKLGKTRGALYEVDKK